MSVRSVRRTRPSVRACATTNLRRSEAMPRRRWSGCTTRSSNQADLPQRRLDALERLRAHVELVAGRGAELAAENLHARVDAVELALQRLDQQVPDLGIGGEILADLLDQLADLLALDGDRQRQVELLDPPVARGVAHGAERAVGHEMQRPVVVAQRHAAQRDALDRALAVAAGLDVLADAERVLGQVEHARDHVAHQRLRAEAEGDADNTSTGE